MSEIAKCPLCGKDPEVWCRDEEIRIRIVCCKHAAYSTLGWNQYAAAMALASAAVWAGECEDQRDYMDDTTSNRDAWRSIVNLDLEANDEACKALERCEEVFSA